MNKGTDASTAVAWPAFSGASPSALLCLMRRCVRLQSGVPNFHAIAQLVTEHQHPAASAAMPSLPGMGGMLRQKDGREGMMGQGMMGQGRREIEQWRQPLMHAGCEAVRAHCMCRSMEAQFSMGALGACV